MSPQNRQKKIKGIQKKKQQKGKTKKVNKQNK